MAIGILAGKKRADDILGNNKKSGPAAFKDEEAIKKAADAAKAKKDKRLKEAEKNPEKRDYMRDKVKRDIERDAAIETAQAKVDNTVGFKGGLLDGILGKEKKKAEEELAKAKEGSPFDRGRDKAIDVLGAEGLGRLSEKENIQEAISETRDFRKTAEMGTGLAKEQLDRAKGLTSRYEKMANEGISTEAREAMRTKMAQQMGQASQMAGLRAGAALGGMRGAGAAAQQRSLMGQALMGRAGIERDIFLQSEAAKERGLAGMGAALGGERGALAGVQTGIQGERAALGDFASRVGQIESFDIGQAAAEKELIGRLGLSFEQMKSQERSAALAAQAQMKSGGGGKK